MTPDAWTAQRRLAGLVSGSYAFDSLDEFRAGLLGLLAEAVPSAIVSYNEVDEDPDRTWALSRPHLDADLVAAFARLAHENPVLEHIRRTRDGRPRRISDFLDREQLHRLALFREVYAQLGVESQVAFTLPSAPTVVIGIALSRGRHDYTDGEVRLLAAARPHLIQAYRAVELASLRAAVLAALEDGLDAVANPVLAIDARGRIAFATRSARRLLARELGAPDEGAGRVPRVLLDALEAGAAAGGAAGTAVVVAGRGRPVTARAIGEAGERGVRIVLLEGGDGGLSVAALRGLGLTDRQAQALRWTALGRSVREAAGLMGISPRTLEKHLQSVYAALGVASRSQAAATAGAAVGVGPPPTAPDPA
jgi:DNA-binding CsgD family transcriptional regulator